LEPLKYSHHLLRMALFEAGEEFPVARLELRQLLVERLAFDPHQPREGFVPVLIAGAPDSSHALDGAKEIGPRIAPARDEQRIEAARGLRAVQGNDRRAHHQNATRPTYFHG
jgi:hypothetical protein